MKIFAFIFLLAVTTSFAQTDWQRWEAKKVSYLLPTINEKKDSTEQKSFSGIVLNSLKTIYSITISDYDGDNCPFTPSCAEFFVESVEETNLLNGILMFADRFTRDMNFMKDTHHYSLHKNGKYFDPPHNYTLNLQQIKFEPENNE